MCSSMCLSNAIASEFTKRRFKDDYKFVLGIWSGLPPILISCKTVPICDVSSHSDLEDSDSCILLLIRMPVSGKPEQERGLKFLKGKKQTRKDRQGLSAYCPQRQ